MIIRKYNVADSERTVYHIHYRRWTDHHIPDHKEFRALIAIYNKYSLLQSATRLTTHQSLVHCSAGVGRSETFLAIQYLYEIFKMN